MTEYKAIEFDVGKYFIDSIYELGVSAKQKGITRESIKNEIDKLTKIDKSSDIPAVTEALTLIDHFFPYIDADNDGIITESEYGLIKNKKINFTTMLNIINLHEKDITEDILKTFCHPTPLNELTPDYDTHLLTAESIAKGVSNLEEELKKNSFLSGDEYLKSTTLLIIGNILKSEFDSNEGLKVIKKGTSINNIENLLPNTKIAIRHHKFTENEKKLSKDVLSFRIALNYLNEKFKTRNRKITIMDTTKYLVNLNNDQILTESNVNLDELIRFAKSHGESFTKGITLDSLDNIDFTINPKMKNVLQALKTNFIYLDKDGDGYISYEELRKINELDRDIGLSEFEIEYSATIMKEYLKKIITYIVAKKGNHNKDELDNIILKHEKRNGFHEGYSNIAKGLKHMRDNLTNQNFSAGRTFNEIANNLFGKNIGTVRSDVSTSIPVTKPNTTIRRPPSIR